MKRLFMQSTCNGIVVLHENIFVVELVYSIILLFVNTLKSYLL